MRLIVGLGNPGSRYDGTRHNVGYDVTDRFASLHGMSFREGKGDFLFARKDLDDIPIAVIKPTTYMNDSGRAVEDALGIFGASPEDTLVVFDDFHLPLGTLRLRKSGTDGGHNGMASVIYTTGTDHIARLRCGIGREPIADVEGSMTAFVLSRFDEDERDAVRDMIERAAAGITRYVRRGIDAAMNDLNRKPEQNGQQDD